jgi:cytochrome P450
VAVTSSGRWSSSIPTSGGWPVLGHTVPFLRGTSALLAQQRERHGDVFGLTVLGQPTVAFLTPEATRTIYLDRERVFSSEIGWSFTIGPMFRRGLMLRDFDDHRFHRRVMQQAFRRVAIEGYMARVRQITAEHLQDLHGPVDVYAATKRLTLDIAAQVFAGASLGKQARVVNDSFVAMMRASVDPLRRNVPGTPFARGLTARRTLQQLFGEMVADRRDRPESVDLLSRLAHATTEDGDLLPVDEVVDHMIFLLLAAHDTTTSTLTVMLWELARNPDWQQRVVDEVADLGGTAITLESQQRLEATELVMKEALRLSPPVPFSPRGVLRDTEIDGWQIAAGTMVTAASLGLHRHPDWWTSPDVFDPDRFSPSRAEHEQHSHLYVPFGGGAHLCIGMHVAELMIKAIVAELFAQHRVHARTGQTVRMQAVPIPKPRGGLVLTVA